MTPRSKATFRERSERLVYGNCLRTWRVDVDGFPADFSGRLGVRFNRPGGPFRTGMTLDEARAYVQTLNVRGYTPRDYYLSEAAPHDELRIQGEISRSADGLYLRWSALKTDMRRALEEDSHHAFGLEADARLRDACWPRSYQMLMDVLDVLAAPQARAEDLERLQRPLTYGGHEAIIEFSAFSCALGRIPGHNVLIWEYRDY